MDDAIHRYYMNEALKEARLAFEHDEVPVGAILVSGNRMLAKTRNQVEQLKDVTAHAELLAITAASQGLHNKFLDQCTLYVTLEPCPMCAAALGWARIGTIFYAAQDDKRGYTLFNPNLLHPKTKVMHGLMEDECSALVTEFFKRKR
jgi:tRNA(adenine34) deaminase